MMDIRAPKYEESRVLDNAEGQEPSEIRTTVLLDLTFSHIKI